jgi:D-alanyl-D-alanine carboxypeptidase
MSVNPLLREGEMRYLRLFLVFILFLSSISYSYAADDPNTAQIKQDKIQKILDNWRRQSGIPSAALSVYKNDTHLRFNSGVTKVGGGESVHSGTLYQAGSITKSFTSTIILKLEAEGKLNIDDPITVYLPQYSQWKNITIRQLLNHTSGIYNYTNMGTFNRIRRLQPQAQFTPEQIVRIASQHRGYFPPGKGWKYSNTNYVLAGMIIEKITGRPVSDVINETLHQNLNLVNTYYAPGIYTNSLLTRMAHGYNGNGTDVTYDNMSWANTAGAIVTTPDDLLVWWRGLFEGNILPPRQMNEMTSLICEGTSARCARGNPMSHLSENVAGKGYGLGVIQSSFASKKTGVVWWHNGSTRGYKAIVMWFPKSNIYMALAISRDPGYLLKPNLAIIHRILSVLNADHDLDKVETTFSRHLHRTYSYLHHKIQRKKYKKN